MTSLGGAHRQKTFLLVHGSWHGSWCWAKVVAQLQNHGHNAIVLDLPGRAGDTMPPKEITPDVQAEKICRVAGMQAGPVILVGHSMGGMAVTQAAERCCQRIETLVYLCAFIPANGQSLLDVYKGGGTGMVLPNIVEDETAGTASFREDAPLKEIFYHDCSEADFRRASAMLVPEPVAPRKIPVKTTPERYGRVRKVYIECLEDRAIPPEIQKRMYTDTPCERVISMTVSHSPFLSKPEELAAHLISI